MAKKNNVEVTEKVDTHQKKKIVCPNCHLPIDNGQDKCPFCGADLVKKEEVEVATSDELDNVQPHQKKKISLLMLLFLIGLGVGLLTFILFILPASGNNGALSLYYWVFNTTTSIGEETIAVGTNAATIDFVFLIVAVLNGVAVLRSVHKKTAEIGLFAIVTIFLYLVVSVVSFLSPVLMSISSNGTRAAQFTFGIGFLFVGMFTLAAAAINIVAYVLYRKQLKAGPAEPAK